MKKILVVDDQEDVVYTVERILSGKYEIVKCYGGADALAKLKADKFDGVILDIMMPEVDGWAVLDDVRAGKDGIDKDTKILILTALTDKVSKSMADGKVSDYIEKPIDNDNLLSRVEKVVGS